MNIKSILFLIILSVYLIPWGIASTDTGDMKDMGDMNMGDMQSHENKDNDMGHDTGHNNDMSGNVNWLVIASLVGIIGTSGVLYSKTEKLKNKNFLDFDVLTSLLKSRWYPLIFVVPTIIMFTIILVQLFFGESDTSMNLGSVMVWIFLWPILPLLFLLFGRLWCSICPMSRISDEVQKRVGKHKKVPKILQKYGVWVIIIAFLIITWSDSLFGLVESTRNTGYLLLFVFIGVVFTGMLFERRAWCRYLCFLGGMSSNYSMSSALELRADKSKCASCKDPKCYKGSEKAEGCPMFEYPRAMDSNRFCNFCSNCIKNCPQDAIRITPRPPTKELWFIKKPRFEESFLATVLIGIVVVQTVVMLEVWEPFMKWFENTTKIINFDIAWTVIFLGAMFVPIILMLISSLISTSFSGKVFANDIRNKFVLYGYSLIPLGLGIHLAHNAKHFFGEGLSIIYTSASLIGFNIMGSVSLLNMPTIQILQYVLTVLGIVGSVYTAHIISQNNSKSMKAVLPFMIVILMFGILSLWMYSVPMSARTH